MCVLGVESERKMWRQQQWVVVGVVEGAGGTNTHALHGDVI